METKHIEEVPTDQGYDRWSEIYDAEDNPLIAIEEQRVAAMLGDVRGLAVADVGCGTGRHAVRLATLGARVTAVDFSEGMLRQARQKPGAEHVTFVRHDISRPLPLDSGAFDRVLSCLVVDHVTALAELFRELKRICRADGAVLITVMHPAMMLKGVKARFTDPSTGREVRPLSAEHQISDYVMAAVEVGLRIRELGEYAMDELTAARSPRAAKYLGWPFLFTMKLSP